MRGLLYLSAGITCLLLLFLIGYILYRGLPNLNWTFLTSQESVLRGTDGIMPAIQNTLYVIVVTLIFILPLGVGAAIYLTEYASNHKLVSAIEFATETLAGIPSILYALVGMLIFCQVMDLGKTLLAGAPHPGHHDPAHHHPHHPGVPEDGAPELPGGFPGPGGRQVAHDPTVVLPLLRGRHRHRLHPVHRPCGGRVCGALFTAGMGTTLQNFSAASTTKLCRIFCPPVTFPFCSAA